MPILESVRAFVLLLIPLIGCVERRLFVKTDPPGAFIRINNRDVGPAPAEWRFDHYGTIHVEVELKGHESQEVIHKLRKPWYQQPVIDFFADVLWPGTIRDNHELALKMEPRRTLSEGELESELKALSSNAAKRRAEAKRQ
ncbi:MAG: PEGA domain-containing protein [Planctomycetota bacterium]|jgi:hypothetical protein